jgi:hypothetical protein
MVAEGGDPGDRLVHDERGQSAVADDRGVRKARWPRDHAPGGSCRNGSHRGSPDELTAGEASPWARLHGSTSEGFAGRWEERRR